MRPALAHTRDYHLARRTVSASARSVLLEAGHTWDMSCGRTPRNAESTVSRTRNYNVTPTTRRPQRHLGRWAGTASARSKLSACNALRATGPWLGCSGAIELLISDLVPQRPAGLIEVDETQLIAAFWATHTLAWAGTCQMSESTLAIGRQPLKERADLRPSQAGARGSCSGSQWPSKDSKSR
jgi:hypothetical protein